jgi:uncharacterized protein
MLQDDQVVITLQELTRQMARAVVTHPDRVRIETAAGASMTILELSVAPEDMGRIIGKEGRVANAMRTLLRASAAQMNKRVTLEIIETTALREQVQDEADF